MSPLSRIRAIIIPANLINPEIGVNNRGRQTYNPIFLDYSKLLGGFGFNIFNRYYSLLWSTIIPWLTQIESIHVSKPNRLQRGFAPVVFNNQTVLERDTSKYTKITLWAYIILMGSHISKSLTNKSTPAKIAANLKRGYSLLAKKWFEFFYVLYIVFSAVINCTKVCNQFASKWNIFNLSESGVTKLKMNIHSFTLIMSKIYHPSYQRVP